MTRTIAILAAATFFSVGQTASAAEKDTAKMPKQVIVSTVNETSSAGASWVIPLILLIVLASALAADGSGHHY